MYNHNTTKNKLVEEHKLQDHRSDQVKQFTEGSDIDEPKEDQQKLNQDESGLEPLETIIKRPSQQTEESMGT